MAAHGTVYVIDDDGAVRHSIQVLLEVEGFRVLAFASAIEFLQHSREDGYGCIVTDIQMPGMNGLQLIKEVRRRDEVIPIIAMTAAPRAALEKALAIVERTWLLEKPFKPGELVDLVANALRKRLH